MEQAALKQLTSAVHDFSLTQYAQASSFTFFAWDYFVTLPNESRYFWSGKWTYARILFFLNRYQTMGWMIFNVAASNLNFSCLAWGRHIAEASAANLAVQIYLLLHFAADSPRVALPWKPGEYTCTGGHGQPQGLFLSIIPSLVFDIAVLALVIIQGLSHIRTSRRNTGFLGVKFIRAIMTDSVAHFVVILLVYVAIELAWFKLPVVQTYFVYSFGVPIISVAGTRILINLKRQADPSPTWIINNPTSLYSSSTLR
ncbi:hypothetical protein ONZ45_g7517 [Pleurotus djamor]|nr:hypothetical protein ONZ45_g7517 [Pleurotus djamor]